MTAPRARHLLASLALLCLLAPARPAEALIAYLTVWPTLPIDSPVIESVEWMTADADLVIRARVEDVEQESQTPGQVTWLKVHVEIEQIYHSSSRVSPNLLSLITVGTWRRDPKAVDRPAAETPDPPPWHATSGKVLLFLDHRSRLGPDADPVHGCDFIVRRHGGYLANRAPAVEQAVRLNFMGGVATVAHEWLTDRGAITRRVEESARYANNPRRLEIFDFNRPVQRLIVPANPLLERDARLWALNGDNSLTSEFADFISYQKRISGADLLGYCPSPESERALRFLLDEPRGKWSTQPFGIARPINHPLRRAAREALARQGLDVRSAIVEEPTDWYRPITRSATGAALLALAITLTATLRPNPLRRLRLRTPPLLNDRPAQTNPNNPPRLRTALTTLFTLLTLAFATLWLRSTCGVDSVRHGASTRLCEITSFHGNLQLRLDPNYHGTPGLAAARFHPEDPADQSAWDPSLLPPPTWSHAGLSLATQSDPTNTARPITYLLIPHAWLTALFATLPALALLTRTHHHLRRRHRRRNNLCPACGYDCRATPAACPECGATPQVG